MYRKRKLVSLVLGCALVAPLVTGCLVFPRPHARTTDGEAVEEAPSSTDSSLPTRRTKSYIHVHGPSCGHVFIDGRWVSIEVDIGH